MTCAAAYADWIVRHHFRYEGATFLLYSSTAYSGTFLSEVLPSCFCRHRQLHRSNAVPFWPNVVPLAAHSTESSERLSFRATHLPAGVTISHPRRQMLPADPSFCCVLLPRGEKAALPGTTDASSACFSAADPCRGCRSSKTWSRSVTLVTVPASVAAWDAAAWQTTSSSSKKSSSRY